MHSSCQLGVYPEILSSFFVLTEQCYANLSDYKLPSLHGCDLQHFGQLSQSTCLTPLPSEPLRLAVPSPHRHVSCNVPQVQAIAQPYVHLRSTITDKTMKWNIQLPIEV